jgi:hypothetical protein
MVLALAKGRGNTKRESETLHVRVTEPPLSGRPPGYAIGDVGRFDLSTEATPREIERGGAVGVTVELSGSGNLPAQLTMPTRNGVEWLVPEVHEKVGAMRGGDRWGGKRTFSYVVRVQQEGDVDLGAIELPYFDPDTRVYATARAPIGTIHVKPGLAPARADAAPDALPGLPDPKDALAFLAARPRRPHLTSGVAYWVALAASPLAWVLFAGARAATRGLRARSKERAADPAREMKSRIAEADTASKNGDAHAMDVATARALEASLIACAGVNLRGTTGDAAEEELARAGVGDAHAKHVVELYRACEAARFSPDSASASAAKERWTTARTLIAALGKSPRAADA